MSESFGKLMSSCKKQDTVLAFGHLYTAAMGQKVMPQTHGHNAAKS